MTTTAARLQDFVKYVRAHLSGDEKGEAHIFCERLFQAFGHAGIKEAGGTLEFRVHKGKGTKFADLLWRPRLLLEMKKRGEKLAQHYRQVFDYWLYAVPQRPRYVMLCNFDEFWVYDFEAQMDEPVDRLTLDELPERYTAFNFLFPAEQAPQFNNNRVPVTRAAAAKLAGVFNRLIDKYRRKPIPREKAQRYILQCVVALFAEDIDLLPRGLFTELLADCRKGGSSFDLIGGLFRQMASPTPAEGGRFQGVPYFNGGLFAVVEPIELDKASELPLLAAAADDNWAQVQPPVFGTLFEQSMDHDERHAFGAHFTSEADIQKVVLPTIVRPWTERIAAAKTDRELLALWEELDRFRVLDPACGSGNFLYVAYRELKRLETELLSRLSKAGRLRTEGMSVVSAGQFFGIDIKPFAVELAKVTLMLAKKLALDEREKVLGREQAELEWERLEKPLPLENLDNNIRCDDALFCEWPKADAIIGNPPYQSKNKMQQEFGPEYVQKVRAQYPKVPGRADYCVYWFRRAHDELSPGARAGLVGTNTIRQNYSREGGLDHIVGNGGTITEAVSTQVWSGEAAVHVSIVNWLKGEAPGAKKLLFQLGDDLESPWKIVEREQINAALSADVDVTAAVKLSVNVRSQRCDQGQTPGHEAFLLDPDATAVMIRHQANCKEVLFPYLTGDEMIGDLGSQPRRHVIDFHPRDVLAARAFKEPFARIEEKVLPARKAAAEAEETRNAAALAANPKAKVNKHHRNFLARWWLLSYPRERLIAKLAQVPRYIVCGRVTKRPIFEFIDARIRPSDALQVFAFPDDYSFGILQSGIHWAWFKARCSTLKGDFRYTSDTVFDTFPWPQEPTLGQVQEVAAAAVALRGLRRRVMAENRWSLRDLYRTLETPGKNPLRDAHEALDAAVREAYGMKPKADPLAFLLELNHAVAARETKGEPVTAPGLPPCVSDPKALVSDDCVRIAT